MKHPRNPNRAVQMTVGVAILLALALAGSAAILGWHYLPGIWGDWLGLMVGWMTTPFVLEAVSLMIGMAIVLAINHWRLRRDGDEWIDLRELNNRDLRENPSPQVMAEGAMAIGDYETASDCLASLSPHDLHRPDVLALRLALARATGKHDLANALDAELQSTQTARPVSHS